ncbi:MAG: flavodoxin family protein [Desulfobulbaceae bacterium]|nr:flavodoxin family protein [Desulfobulbaceae bacterium]
MKQLVVYSSQGGNTKKLAETVFKQLPEDTDIKPVAETLNPGGYDIVCVGFWFKGGQPDPASQEFLKKCTSGKVFLFATHGTTKDSDHAKMGMNKARELVGGATVIGTFNCQGEVPEKVMENAANKDPQPPWLKDAPAAKGHPDGDDLYNLCQELEKAGLMEKLPPKENMEVAKKFPWVTWRD